MSHVAARLTMSFDQTAAEFSRCGFTLFKSFYCSSSVFAEEAEAETATRLRAFLLTGLILRPQDCIFDYVRCHFYGVFSF